MHVVLFVSPREMGPSPAFCSTSPATSPYPAHSPQISDVAGEGEIGGYLEVAVMEEVITSSSPAVVWSRRYC